MDERKDFLGWASTGRVEVAGSVSLADWLDKHVGPLWKQYAPGSVPGLAGMALLARFVAGPGGRRVVAGLVLLGDAVTADQLRKVPIAELENGANLGQREYRELAALPPLAREGLEPVEFSRRVAEHYQAYARHLPHPVAAMAAKSGVKSSTLHGWIREARLRGFLPPASRRKGSTSS